MWRPPLCNVIYSNLSKALGNQYLLSSDVDQYMPLQNMQLLHKHYFELKAFEFLKSLTA